MFSFNVQQQYLDGIKSGVKNIEGRLAKSEYRLLEINSTIVFFNNEHTQKAEKKIASLRIYKSFREAFKVEDYRKAVPGVNGVGEAIDVYEQFYSKAEQLKHGVIFIEIT